MYPGQKCPDPNLLPVWPFSVPCADCCDCWEHGPDWQGKIFPPAAGVGMELLDVYLQPVDSTQTFYTLAPPWQPFWLNGKTPGGWDGGNRLIWQEGRLNGEKKSYTNHYVVANMMLAGDSLQGGDVTNPNNYLRWPRSQA